MQKKVLLSLLLVLITLAVFWLWPKTETAVVSAGKAQAPVVADPQKDSLAEVTEPVQMDQYQQEELQQSFSLLSQVYAAELSYPPYSRPLSAADYQLLNPNHFDTVALPLEGGASASLVLPKYRFSYPETVVFTLVMEGVSPQYARAELREQQSGKVLAQADLTATPDSTEWPHQFDASENWDGAMELVVLFEAEGKTQQLQTGLDYSYPVATITGIGSSSTRGADLVIPVQLDVKKTGMYRLRANLFTESKQPLAVLTAEGKLTEGAATLDLKAFKQVLQQQGGPYWLGTFVLELRSARPGEVSRYGDSKEPGFMVDAINFGQLSDEPFVLSDEEKQRLLFLQRLADGG
ncbi:hypothetical protein EMM73_02540 [Rheinheimera sediminis]|uniref:hypothetical protein n=1 Tax=Rheinheimera sp. YQF-1 TaxID=2499626 RepID=UPI000FDA46CE|nr:hypothetical protein [Rheinheimera sp. YQF-1]RVT48189.1 hypothetical protein EMM73_02540 [Rheinheimera sp. YQF-1]